MKIVTEADTTGFAPRSCRYSAVDEDRFDGAEDSRTRSEIGYGATPEAAIADLMALLADEADLDAEWQSEEEPVMEISIEALKLRRREIEINVAMNQGALDEINHIIAEMERRRGGRPRKSVEIAIIPQRVEGAAHETETEESAA